MIRMVTVLFEIGLVIGWIGGVTIPGRRVLPVVLAVCVGLAAAAAGGALSHAVLGDAFPLLRDAIAVVVTLLGVGAYTLHERDRRLPQ